MANVQIDPLQSIVTALRGIFKAPAGAFKDVVLGWPDTKYFSVDGNLPVLVVMPASETGKHLTSRENVHVSIKNADGLTSTVYTEQLRKYYLLQLSIFANTQQDRSNLGWTVEQYLTTNPRLQIGIQNVESSMWKFMDGPRDDTGETRLYQRDYTYEVQARVLDATQSVPILKTLTQNDKTP